MKLHKLYFWLLTILSFVPMGAILGRTIYVQKNENAYLSYSDEYVTRAVKLDNSNTSLIQNGQDYIFNGVSQIRMGTGNNVRGFTWSSCSIDFREKYNLSYDVSGIGLSTDGNYSSYFKLWFYDELTSNFVQYQPINGNYIDANSDFAKELYGLSFTFTFDEYKNYLNDSVVITLFNLDYFVSTKGNLDNAFTYSIKEFNDIGFNKIQFVQWFTNMFTTTDNLYVVFVNSYANYFLFVSTSMLLPYFIYWFVTLIVSYMSRFTRKELR